MSASPKAGVVVLALALVAYPLVFLLLHDVVGLTGLCLLLVVLALARLAAHPAIGAAGRWAAAVSAGLFALAVSYWQSATLLKLYPVLANGALLTYGIYTLQHPPSAIERLVRRLDWPVSGAGRGYMRGVTLLWCVFFTINGGIAAFTALEASTEIWAWYNGVVSYILAAVLFGAEWLFRGFYRRRHLPPEVTGGAPRP